MKASLTSTPLFTHSPKKSLIAIIRHSQLMLAWLLSLKVPLSAKRRNSLRTSWLFNANGFSFRFFICCSVAFAQYSSALALPKRIRRLFHKKSNTGLFSCISTSPLCLYCSNFWQIISIKLSLSSFFSSSVFSR